MKRIIFVLIPLFTIAILFSACNRAEFDSAQSAVTDSYSSEDAAYDENSRAVIKTAQIALKVDQLETSIMDLKSFLKPINGYVYNYEISNNSYETDHFQKNMDSSVSVEQISPVGNLSVRIPINHADSFINYVLKSDAQIASLKISDDDVTENLWEKKQMANVYSNSGNPEASGQVRKGNSESIAYDNNTAVDAIRAKASAAKLDYKTKYLWFDINMSAKPFYKSTTTIAAKNYRTPLHVSFANALVTGWHLCADVIIGIVSIWPFMIFIGLIIFCYRKYRLRYS